MDMGTLCLSSYGGDGWYHDPNESCGAEDRHKAPTLLHIHPLSLQDGRGCFLSFPIRLYMFIRSVDISCYYPIRLLKFVIAHL